MLSESRLPCGVAPLFVPHPRVGCLPQAGQVDLELVWSLPSRADKLIDFFSTEAAEKAKAETASLRTSVGPVFPLPKSHGDSTCEPTVFVLNSGSILQLPGLLTSVPAPSLVFFPS